MSEDAELIRAAIERDNYASDDEWAHVPCWPAPEPVYGSGASESPGGVSDGQEHA